MISFYIYDTIDTMLIIHKVTPSLTPRCSFCDLFCILYCVSASAPVILQHTLLGGHFIPHHLHSCSWCDIHSISPRYKFSRCHLIALFILSCDWYSLDCFLLPTLMVVASLLFSTCILCILLGIPFDAISSKFPVPTKHTRLVLISFHSMDSVHSDSLYR